MAKNMGTKAQAYNLAKRTGCTIENANGDLVLSAPGGKLLDGVMHYSAFVPGDVPLGEIWTAFIDEMSNMSDCDCGCADN
jgi:hypothetical protein